MNPKLTFHINSYFWEFYLLEEGTFGLGVLAVLRVPQHFDLICLKEDEEWKSKILPVVMKVRGSGSKFSN